MRTLLATQGRQEFKRRSRHDSWQEVGVDYRQNTTPLHFLINNEGSTVESLRMVCNTWPRVVHIRGNEHDLVNTILLDLTYTCSDDDDIERLQKFSDVLFDAAAKTKEGVQGLVCASNHNNTSIGDYHEKHEENDEEQTVFHIATTYFTYPEGPLPIFLKQWPDALKYLGESTEASGSYPFHNIFKHCRHYESLVKSIEAFAQYSSLDAFACGLLYTTLEDGYCFDLFVQALEGSEVNMASRYHPMKVDETWQHYLAKVVDNLLERRDSSGRSLLHYIAAYDAIDNFAEYESYKIARKMQSDCRKAGLNFPHDPFSVVSGESDDEELGLAIVVWWKKWQQQRKDKVGEVARWILKRNESLTYSVDNDGLNSLQYSASLGRTWDNNLSIVARIEPEWARQQQNGSMSAFAIAAHSCNDLDTVFDLLRFDTSVLVSTGWVDNTATRRNECAAEKSDVEMDKNDDKGMHDILTSLKPLAKALVNHPNRDIFLSQLESMRIVAETDESKIKMK